ncbi:MAG: NUDIX domain-containing protein [Candidatus Omnitrophota bacterium]|nr:NUDIX domain-containing protein [Candidatus Omnitrophota bacterium]
MKIKDTEIIVVNRGIFGPTKRMIFDTALKTDEDTIRKFIRKTLSVAQKNKVKSLVFSSSPNPDKSFPYSAASKIMAQEVFRHIQTVSSPTLARITFILHRNDIFRIFQKNITDYLEHMTKKIAQGPFLTVDGIIEYKSGIVLIERSNPPLGWALPGGFVDYGESVEDAVRREIKEETNLSFVNFRQFRVCSMPKRDPRFHTVSVVFIGKGQGKLKSASDAKAAKVFKLDDLPSKIAFDHRAIIKDYICAESR